MVVGIRWFCYIEWGKEETKYKDKTFCWLRDGRLHGIDLLQILPPLAQLNGVRAPITAREGNGQNDGWLWKNLAKEQFSSPAIDNLSNGQNVISSQAPMYSLYRWYIASGPQKNWGI